MYETLLLTVEDNIATIKLNRPKSMNSLNALALREVRDAFRECGGNDKVRAVLVTGEGRCFSAGGDMEMLHKLASGGVSAEETKRLAFGAGEMTYAARQCFKPVIAAVNGACFGAGLSLALACDFRVIDANTKMGSAFINAGISGDSGMVFFLKEMLGFALMTDLMMTGRILDAGEITRLGLATATAEDGALIETAASMARRFAKGPTAIYANQKKLFWDYFCKDYDLYAEREAHYMTECTRTSDFPEAVAAFLEKRKPNFSGK